MKTIMIKIQTLTHSSSPNICMKNTVSMAEVAEFKKWWCNENQIITDLITKRLYKYFREPILDAGAGLGDISYNALYDKEVICIDVNEVIGNRYPLSPKHQRKQVNFFDYAPTNKINTLFISHTLQFLDDNLSKLNKKVQEINPVNIVLVINKNDDFLGELLDWSREKMIPSNPEQKIEGFPLGYKLVDEIEFTAKLSCDTYSELAHQISYIMLFDLNSLSLSALINFLQERLAKHEFEFNQVIEIYSRK